MDNIPDPFDPNLLRLDQMFVEGVPIKKYLSTIPVRKPGRQEFVRVIPMKNGGSLQPLFLS